MSNSTHRVEVVPVVLEKHHNADALSIVKIGGYQVVVKTEDWQGKQIGAYIPPDSLVPTCNPLFAWLLPEGKSAEHVRVKAKKLRGEWSMGLLVPAPEGLLVGDDAAEILGVVHYEPPEFGGKVATGGSAQPPPGPYNYPICDVEAFRKYGESFMPGESVMVTEKIHGASGRWVFDGERFHCGSHRQWKREEEANAWWRILRQYPALQSFLQARPNVAVYGEVYGWVQDLKYGHKPGQISLAIFDIMREGRWIDAEETRALCEEHNLPAVPLIGIFPFNFDEFLQLAEGQTQIAGADHYREGVVVKPLTERWDSECGRVCLKIISNQYLEKSK